MHATAADPGLTVPPSAFLVGGQCYETGAPGFAEAVAEAYAARHRPRCLCLVQGVEMYVARLGDGYIVKRMPNTGSHHAPDCPSYEPPAEFSGLGQVLGSAITEDPATGETSLKLDFPMTRIPGRSTPPVTGGADAGVAADGCRLSLRGLLHYLWDQAGLTRWHPGFVGKRNWATVRRHLLQAAEGKIARGAALRARLYIPEVFSVERREPIHARRLAQWARATASPGKPQHLMLLVAEVKGIEPARYGYRAVVKHVPEQSFVIDETLYRRMGRRFERELSLWSTAGDLHMVMIATFGVSDAGVPTIAELCLMTVTGEWLPVEDSFERQLVERLVRDRRSFVKALRYNLPPWQPMTCAILTDCVGSPVALHVAPHEAEGQVLSDAPSNSADDGLRHWFWNPARYPLPQLPE